MAELQLPKWDGQNLDSWFDNFNTAMTTLKQAIESIETGGEIDLSEIEAKINDLQAQVDSIESDNSVVNNQISTINQTIETINSTLSTISQRSLNNEESIDTLTTKVENNTAGVVTLQSGLASVNLEIESIDTRVESLENGLSTADAEIADAKSQIMDVNESVQDLTSKVSTNTSDIQNIDIVIEPYKKLKGPIFLEQESNGVQFSVALVEIAYNANTFETLCLFNLWCDVSAAVQTMGSITFDFTNYIGNSQNFKPFMEQYQLKKPYASSDLVIEIGTAPTNFRQIIFSNSATTNSGHSGSCNISIPVILEGIR